MFITKTTYTRPINSKTDRIDYDAPASLSKTVVLYQDAPEGKWAELRARAKAKGVRETGDWRTKKDWGYEPGSNHKTFFLTTPTMHSQSASISIFSKYKNREEYEAEKRKAQREREKNRNPQAAFNRAIEKSARKKS